MSGLDLETLDHIATPIFVIAVTADMRLEFVTVNAAHTAISGLRPVDVRGKTAMDVYSGRAGRNAWQHHTHVAETGQASNYVITLPFLSGARSFRTTLQPLKDAAGEVHSIVGTMIEITAQRALEASSLMAGVSTNGASPPFTLIAGAPGLSLISAGCSKRSNISPMSTKD